MARCLGLGLRRGLVLIGFYDVPIYIVVSSTCDSFFHGRERGGGD